MRGDHGQSLLRNHIWDMVRFLAGKKTLHNRWAYRVKQNDVSLRYTRLVEKDFQHKTFIDFAEIFSPVVKLNTIRVVFSIVVVEILHLEQMNEKTTLLHDNMEEEFDMF